MRITLRNVGVVAAGAVVGWLLYTGVHMVMAADVKEVA